MTATVNLPLRAAVITLLKGTPAVTALVGGATPRIYDAVPQGAVYPYLVYEDPFESPDRTFGENGHSASFDLTAYTQDGSATSATTGKAGFKSGEQIMEQVVTALVNPTGAPLLVVTGHAVEDVEIEQVQESMVDEKTRRCTGTFTATLKDV